MVTELGLLVCFFVGLHFGRGQKVVALHNALIRLLGCSLLDWGILNWYHHSTTCQPCRKRQLKIQQELYYPCVQSST